MGKNMTEITTTKGRHGVSRYNGMRHGMRAKEAVLPWENAQDFEKLQKNLFTEYSPQTPTQCELVLQLAGIFWRQRRVVAAETAFLEQEALEAMMRSGAPHRTDEMSPYQRRICSASMGNSGGIEVLARHDAHLSRRLNRVLGQLYQLKTFENVDNATV